MASSDPPPRCLRPRPPSPLRSHDQIRDAVILVLCTSLRYRQTVLEHMAKNTKGLSEDLKTKISILLQEAPKDAYDGGPPFCDQGKFVQHVKKLITTPHTRVMEALAAAPPDELNLNSLQIVDILEKLQQARAARAPGPGPSLQLNESVWRPHTSAPGCWPSQSNRACAQARH